MCVPRSSRGSRTVFRLKVKSKHWGIHFHNHDCKILIFQKLSFFQTKYPLISLVQVFASGEERTSNNIRTRVIVGGTLVDEFRNRFVVYSTADAPVMVFSTGHFNVSSVLSQSRLLLVIQAYDIEKRDIVMLKFLVRFEHEEIANNFHEYVTKKSPCINSMIPVDMSRPVRPW